MDFKSFADASQKYKAGERSQEITDNILKFYREKDGEYVFDDDINSNYIRIRAEWALSEMDSLGKPETASVLDLGSWTGAMPNFYYNNGYRNITCVEICKDACGMANKLYPHLKYLCDSVEDYDEGKRFDVITGFELLEHVTTPADFLSKYVNMLNPGGIFLVTVPSPDKVFMNPDDHEHINQIFDKDLYDLGFTTTVLVTDDRQMSWIAAKHLKA